MKSMTRHNGGSAGLSVNVVVVLRISSYQYLLSRYTSLSRCQIKLHGFALKNALAKPTGVILRFSARSGPGAIR